LTGDYPPIDEVRTNLKGQFPPPEAEVDKSSFVNPLRDKSFCLEVPMQSCNSNHCKKNACACSGREHKKTKMTAATTPRPSATEAAAAAAVLADIDLLKFGPDEDNASVVTADDDSENPSSDSHKNYHGDWRNEVDDRPIRRQIMMHM
jgi:hypothetical protein